MGTEELIAHFQSMLDKQAEEMRKNGTTLVDGDHRSITLVVGTAQPPHLRDLIMLRSWRDEATAMVEDIETHPMLLDFAGAVEDALRGLPDHILPGDVPAWDEP